MTLGKERKNTKEIKVAAQIPGNLRATLWDEN